MKLQLDAAGPRDADDAWDRYLRPGRWPEWSPQIRSVEYPLELLAPGTSGTVHALAGVPVPFRVLEVDVPGRSWLWVATVAGVGLTLHHTVEATATGSKTGLTISGFPPAVALYVPLAQWALRRLVR